MINIAAPINSLGYGYVGLNILKAMEELGANPACWCIGGIEVSQEDSQTISRAIDRQDSFNIKAPSLRIYHQFDLASHIGLGVKIGFPIFELDRFKTNESRHLQCQDGLVAASQWAADVMSRCVSSVPIQIAPLAVDHNIFMERPSKEFQGEPTRFLNCGKWELRKGHDFLCEAFSLAFEKSDNVELVMNCHNPCIQDRGKYLTYNSEWESFYRESTLGSKITIATSRLKSQSEVASLMASVDCGVFPSRGEGWNLDATEMLSMGKQLIITDYSAHTEFATVENAMLIPFTTSEAAHDGVWFNANDSRWGDGPGEWMELGEHQLEVLIYHLRSIHRRKQEGDNLSNKSGVKTMKPLTWRNTARKILSFTESFAAHN